MKAFFLLNFFLNSFVFRCIFPAISFSLLPFELCNINERISNAKCKNENQKMLFEFFGNSILDEGKKNNYLKYLSASRSIDSRAKSR